MTRAHLKVVAAAAGLMALSGCVRVTVDSSFSTDDTVSQDIVIAMTDDAATQLGIDRDALTAQFVGGADADELAERFGDRVVVEDFVDGELEGIRVTTTDLTFEEFNASLAGADLPDAVGGISTGTVEREGDTFVVVIPASKARTDAIEGVDPDQAALVESAIDFDISYSFPGMVESASAGTIEGNTVHLGLSDVLSDNEIRIVAGANTAIDWGPILTWGLIALAAIIIIGGATLLVLQDRRRHSGGAGPIPESPQSPGIGLLPTDPPAPKQDD